MMQRYRMNGEVIEGATAEAVVKVIRQGWMTTEKPSLEEMYAFAASLTKLPVKTADDYLVAMLAAGALKPYEARKETKECAE